MILYFILCLVFSLLKRLDVYVTSEKETMSHEVTLETKAMWTHSVEKGRDWSMQTDKK